MNDHKVLFIATFVSLLLLTAFLVLQSRHGPPLDLPKIYLLYSLAPVIIGLFAGKYITRVELPSLKVSNDVQLLPEAVHKKTDPPKPNPQPGDWRLSRENEYTRTSGLMLAHEYKPSAKTGQKFEIYVYLVRHAKKTTRPPRTELNEIAKAEFYFGKSWGHRTFSVEAGEQRIFGVRAHAYGSFLAICRITFKDPRKSPVIVNRYIDYGMAADPV